MKKYLILTSLCLCSFFIAFAQTPPQPSADSDAPVVLVDKDTFDLGKIAPGQHSFEVKVKNVGVKDLIISNVGRSCGCTNTKWPQEPIKKGQTGTVKVDFNAAGSGPVLKNISISSNASVTTKVVYFKGMVESAPVAPPSAIEPAKK